MFSPSQDLGLRDAGGSFAQFAGAGRQLLPRAKHLTWEASACYSLVLATAYRMLSASPARPPARQYRPGMGRCRRSRHDGDPAFAGVGGLSIAVVSEDERASTAGSWVPRDINRREFARWGRMPTGRTTNMPSGQKGMRGFGAAFWAARARASRRDRLRAPGADTLTVSRFIVKRGGMIVFCAGTSGFELRVDLRYMWMRQKRLQGSHFANLLQAAQANKLVIERRVDPAMSEVFPVDADSQGAHAHVEDEHKPGNMAVLVSTPTTGLRTFEDAIEESRGKLLG